MTSGLVEAAEIHVMSSGGLTAACKALIPEFEARSGHKVDLVLGPSMGTAEHAIPVRLKRGEPADVLRLPGKRQSDDQKGTCFVRGS
jgi:molybdate transport system substrate-binding protein